MSYKYVLTCIRVRVSRVSTRAHSQLRLRIILKVALYNIPIQSLIGNAFVTNTLTIVLVIILGARVFIVALIRSLKRDRNEQQDRRELNEVTDAAFRLESEREGTLSGRSMSTSASSSTASSNSPPKIADAASIVSLCFLSAARA